MRAEINRFNIRVYLLLLDEREESLLLSDEIIHGRYYTKFPGGGLEYGEGILDCLQREAREEFGQEVEVLRQFHTSESFQRSSFADADQLVCIYYECRLPRNRDGRRLPRFRIAGGPHDFVHFREREESFRWRRLDEIEPEELSLPLDRQALVRLLDERRKPALSQVI